MPDNATFADAVREGAAILRHQNQLVKQAVRTAQLVDVGYPVERRGLGQWRGIPVVATPILISEIGEGLNARFPEAPFSLTYFDDPERNQRVWGFRTKKKDVDVGAIAKTFGGGGHHGAAGCQTAIGATLWT